MSKIYTCTLHTDLYDAFAESLLELDPNDYLYCDSEEELRDCVSEDLINALYTGDVQWDDSDSDIFIPKEFIDEWELLKHNGEQTPML